MRSAILALVSLGTAALAAFGASGSVARDRVQPSLADACAAPPPAVAALLSRETGWSLLRLADLQSDDRALWNAHRPHACPGFTSAQLGVGTGPAYAVALIKRTQRGTEQKVMLLIPTGERLQVRLLARPHLVSNPAVVWRAGPGKTRSWEGGPVIEVEHDSIMLETLESTAEQFFFVEGRLRTVVTSN